MSAEDYLACDYWDDDLDDAFRNGVRCKGCSKVGFHWKKIDRKWRLHTTTGKLHTCKAYVERLQRRKP